MRDRPAWQRNQSWTHNAPTDRPEPGGAEGAAGQDGGNHVM